MKNITLANKTISINYQTIKQSSIKNCDVSIIIRTRNEAATIVECLNAINSQNTNRKIEIILIDSTSEDKTVEIAKQYSHISIYQIAPKDFNFGSSIQLGIMLAKSKYCIFLSAHAIPANDLWLENLLNKFTDKTIAAAYSRQIYKKDAYFIEQKSLDETFSKNLKIQRWKNSYHNFNDYKKAITFSNASSCIRKDVAMQIPFAEIIASEDREWALRALKHGYKIIYAADSEIYHYHNENPENYYKRILINSKALYSFTGFILPLILCFPLLLKTLSSTLAFLIKKHLLSIRNIKIATHYSFLYVKAHYIGPKSARSKA